MPPSPKPKPRVLSPDAARARSMPADIATQPPSPSSSPPSNPTSSTVTTTTTTTKTSTPTSNAPRPRFSPLTYLRTRFASLSRPVRLTLRTLGVFAPILPMGLYFSKHAAQVLWVNGPSMTPYLNEDYETMHTNRDVVLVRMQPFRSFGAALGLPGVDRRGRIERGMVVTFRSPGNPHHVAIKRIIGLPGDRITTREPCKKDSQIVPWNHVWVEGDAADPHKSLDSNTYGPVSISLISGRVTAVLYPRFRWLDWQGWEEGKVDGIQQEGYREEVRDRVEKGAVQLQAEKLFGAWG
ncbi:putative mitochondrial inner membrane protease subunit Imp2 [Aspergillus undulatus]|uniref:putative mitochondrial inner membrane protease subunit Imp2 n=1 Tax=Aspergillus undulatus TaxID=1810928 RepID=UPI003CCD644B